MLFGCICADPIETPAVLASMAAALRTSPDETLRLWPLGSFGVGRLRRPLASDDDPGEPARAPDGSSLWMSGEAFDWPSHHGVRAAADARRVTFRAHLLDALIAKGPHAIRDLDGEYQIAVWNPHAQSLLLLNDRFGALPLYVANGTRGVAFAGGVRGVLMGPGVSHEPDEDAIREAVTFGGYRLGSRTNIRRVQMVAPASAVTIAAGAMTSTRYWTWSELRDGDATDQQALLEETREAWTAAIRRRLDGARHPGLTLSGGLDSRAILAEAARQTSSTTALTYGVPQSDDVRIARRSARTVNARWQLFPLYEDGWLERRTARIHETDGLMDLVDLMHTEVLEAMPSAVDVYLSGYIGDAVAGSTLFFVDRPEDFLATMPFYGGELGMSYTEALLKAEALMHETPGPARFAPYDHKLPQSTNRITAAVRPFATVRRPFTDYRFFEICQRVPPTSRAQHHWREQWLRSTYPRLFASIPNQQTGVPPGSSNLRRQLTRAARFGWRRLVRTARAAGLPVEVPERTYHPDERFWSRPEARHVIEGTILRSGSISCDIFGRARVHATVQTFFDSGAAPVQVIGALYVFEHYHQTLAAFLADARRQVRSHAC